MKNIVICLFILLIFYFICFKKQDYKHWKSGDPNTFCLFPFMMDAGIKSNILHLESIVNQNQLKNVKE